MILGISDVMLAAVDFLRHKTSFGEIDVKILSENEYRQPPDEFAPAGRVGADIEVEGVKLFLGHECMAEPILWYGAIVADEVVYNCLKVKYDRDK